MSIEPPLFDTVIGIDCATKPENTGLAIARRVDGAWRLCDVQDGRRDGDPADAVAAWTPDGHRILIALDAPLGWPARMSPTLRHHRAGDRISAAPNLMFARETDRHVYATYGKKPLDVGADRIARTALAALVLLDAVRARTGCAVPLWWGEGSAGAPGSAHVAALEVYPAGTLRAHGVHAKGYKKVHNGPGRRAVATLLADRMLLPVDFDVSRLGDDAIDAALCVLAGVDVAEGRAIGPTLEQRSVSRTEGWIWVRSPVDLDPSPGRGERT